VIRLRTWLSGVVAAAVLPVCGAHAADRVALLIGNTTYPGNADQPGVWSRLPNAVNDVRLVADVLKANGFEVEVVRNGDYRAISSAIQRFGDRTSGAKIAVLYYAGHGFEYARHAYFVPVDGPTAAHTGELSQKFVDFEGVANDIAQADVNVFFLDACRTAVPFVKVSTEESQAEIDARSIDDVDFPQGAKIAVLYSTQRGRPALDEAPPPAEYSPFAWEVHRDLAIPNLDLALMFALISEKVADKTNSHDPPQTPYQYGYFTPGIFLAQAPSAVPKQTRTRPKGINIKQSVLAITDGPILIASVLRDTPFADVQALAKAGDSLAAYFLGSMYELGIGVAPDLKTAQSWLEKSAAAGNASGQTALAYFLEHHSSGPGDTARAVNLLKAASLQGFAKAQAHYGLGFMDGTAAPRTSESYAIGRDLMRKAAAQGYPYAMFTLALRGEDDEKGRYEAQLQALAAAGNPDGNHWLCELSAQRHGAGGALQDCLVAARANFANAQAEVAIAYHDGLGVAASSEEAEHWARLAFAQAALRADLRRKLQSFGYSF
jgi:TPR repeat protein